MRPSSRSLILDAAVRVTEQGGITSLTLESVAEEAGLTKGGLMYHFHTREELLAAVHQHLAEAWMSQLATELGKPVEDSTEQDRTAAYVHTGFRSGASKADLAFMLESVVNPEHAQVWSDLMAQWAPHPVSSNTAELDLFLARLATDGFWLYEAITGRRLAPRVREALHRRITDLTKLPHPDQQAPRDRTTR